MFVDAFSVGFLLLRVPTLSATSVLSDSPMASRLFLIVLNSFYFDGVPNMEFSRFDFTVLGRLLFDLLL